ncbi:MAG: hypothetical protein M3O85_08460 [Acidobacteriota bacterium]|nr:hypothetical protein [Acidobacteriota bacterium]
MWIASELDERLLGDSIARADAYRLANGLFYLDSDNLAFLERFRILFRECRIDDSDGKRAPGIPFAWVTLRTLEPQALALVRIQLSRTFPLLSFALELFRDHRLVEREDPLYPEWRILADSGGTPVLGFLEDRVLAFPVPGWQALVAELATSALMCLQEDVLFFHAATISIGQKGVFITGDKGQGKTTLSLALAARGHGFLGDEYAAVSFPSAEILPFRRAVSIRPGPQSEGLAEYLENHDYPTDRTPEGTTRVRASVADIFPGPLPRAAKLTHAFFLEGFAAWPSVREVAADGSNIPFLRPLVPTIWGRSGRVAFDLLRILSGIRCFAVIAGGSPDETASLIETTVEEAWA